jgi:hypothetical protein
MENRIAKPMMGEVIVDRPAIAPQLTGEGNGEDEVSEACSKCF